MLKKTISLLLFVCIFISCKRDEPVTAITNGAPVTELKLLATYNTSVPEPSGLTYNSKTNTLLTVSDGNSTVYELDFMGRILRSFIIAGQDLEGITLSANCDTMYVVEETNQLVSKYLINGNKLYSFPVNVAINPKNALEGITLDNNNHLFVLNEKTPGMMLEFVNKKEIARKEFNYTLDCSDIFYDSSLNCFWMVSDESQKVVKLSKDGTLLANYSVPFFKGEGIAVVQDKIYIVNDEDNKFYIFQKPN